MQLIPLAFPQRGLTPAEIRSLVASAGSEEHDDRLIAIADEEWPSDSVVEYTETACAIDAARDPALSAGIGQLISNEKPLDEYGVADDAIFASVSPTTAQTIIDHHATCQWIPAQLPEGLTPEEITTYVEQWIDLLRWSVREQLGLAFGMY